MTLDPPYRLASEALTFVFRGWAQVADPRVPDIGLSLNGVSVPVVITRRPPRLEAYFPGIDALEFRAEVDFREVLAKAPLERLREPFLLEATLTSDGFARMFEYEVTHAWLLAVFGRPMRRRPMPPEHLQIRVAGAAAGAFHATGEVVADRICALLAGVNQPLQPRAAVLDLGCGPGRVAACLREREPRLRLSACDIDPEAVAWANRELGHVAEFRATGERPPLPYGDASFDLVYAISVFTHLPEDLQHEWLRELRRILKPGGVLLTTKMNPAAYDLPDKVQAAAEADGFAYWDDAQRTDGLPGFYRLAYHRDDYVRRVWGRSFEVLHVGRHDLNGTQDAVILRRPNSLAARVGVQLERTFRTGPPPG